MPQRAHRYSSTNPLGCRPLRILIFHGYLLIGTGSNVYNAELGAALVRAGHEVHMLAQERSPFELDWVDAAAADPVCRFSPHHQRVVEAREPETTGPLVYRTMKRLGAGRRMVGPTDVVQPPVARAARARDASF